MTAKILPFRRRSSVATETERRFIKELNELFGNCSESDVTQKPEWPENIDSHLPLDDEIDE